LVVEEPAGFEVTITSKSCPIAGIADEERSLYGVQFHPEVRHSVYGNELLKNFALNVCGCKGDWTMENFSEV
ncbi:GMP synthase (glutamine-hydrolyzing), partial [Escherichia coli]|nr:GMP synthase (glutamine-hydrolyzing) [Escherichia coli]